VESGDSGLWASWESRAERARRFGPYVLRGELGRGASGVVFRARRAGLERDVALKVLHAADPESIARFEREARLASRLDDPGVVPVYDVGRVGQRSYYAMELCPGPTLEARLREGPLEIDEALALVGDLARSVGRAHAAGIVHRDLKPANAILDPGSGRPRITDFGVARDAAGGALTRTGDVLGTPFYMAPEAFRGARAVDARSDVYALGVILYECLTGRRPYAARTPLAQMRLVRAGGAAPPSSLRDDVPPRVDRVVGRALAVDPGARYADAGTLAAALDRARAGADTPDADAPAPARLAPEAEPSGAGRAWLVAVPAAGLLAAGAVVAVAVATWPEPTDPGAVAGRPTARSSESPDPADGGAAAPPTVRDELTRLVRLSHEPRPYDPVVADALADLAAEAPDPDVAAEAALARAEYLMRRGRHEAAREAAAPLAERRDWIGAGALRVEAYARWKLGSSDPGPLEVLARRDPGGPRGLEAEGVLEMLVGGDLRAAVKLLERARRLDPDYAETLIFLARARFALGEREAARAAAAAARAALPDDPTALTTFALTHIPAGDLSDLDQSGRADVEAALAALGRAVALTAGRDLDAHQLRAALLKRLGRLEAAEAALTELIETNARNGEGYLMRGVVRAELGRPDEAAADWRRAEEVVGFTFYEDFARGYVPPEHLPAALAAVADPAPDDGAPEGGDGESAADDGEPAGDDGEPAADDGEPAADDARGDDAAPETGGADGADAAPEGEPSPPAPR